MKIVDLFAGAGGASTGASLAGAEILLAANHWELAIQYHEKNHPNTIHICQDLKQADFTQFPKHDMLWASPSCVGHSKARGKDRPHHDSERATAWAVIDCVECHRPDFAVVENVVEFADWQLFPVWKKALRTLGYQVSGHVVNSAHFGVPQARVRMFIVCTKSKNKFRLKNPKKEWITARSIIDWEDGRWNPIYKPNRAQSTIKQIEKGREKYGDRFYISFYGSSSGGRDLDQPFGTLTTKARFALVDGDRMRMLTKRETMEAMGFPEDYILPDKGADYNKMIGNAVPPPVAQGIVEQIMERG